MNWRDKLPELPSDWVWLDEDVATGLVMLRPGGMFWLWLTVKSIAEADGAVWGAFREAVERAKRQGVSSACVALWRQDLIPRKLPDGSLTAPEMSLWCDIVETTAPDGAWSSLNQARGHRRDLHNITR